MRINFLGLVISAIIFLSFQINAQTISESEKSVRIEYKNNADAKTIYSKLALPIDFGNEVTGTKHQYKIYKDKTDSVMLYCDGNFQSNRCILDIAKKDGTDLVSIYHEPDYSSIEIYDINETKKLYDYMLVPVMEHGGFLMKVLATEDLGMSMSCIQKIDNPEWIQCALKILRPSQVSNPIEY